VLAPVELNPSLDDEAVRWLAKGYAVGDRDGIINEPDAVSGSFGPASTGCGVERVRGRRRDLSTPRSPLPQCPVRPKVSEIRSLDQRTDR
jgi:hypothetical protein